MGKVSKCIEARNTARKNKRRYTNSCTDLGKKWVAVLVSKDNDDRIMVGRGPNSEPPALCSPLGFTNAHSSPKTPCSKHILHCSIPMAVNNPMRTPRTPCSQGRLSSSPSILDNIMKTPKTPCAQSRLSSPPARSSLFKTPNAPLSQETPSESRLESLPNDILVKVLCHLHHDQLRPAFHVSRRIREAVILARQYHFNFTTPDRSRQALLNTTTPKPWEHWPFIKHMNSALKPCPRTPKPLKHISKPPPKLKSANVCQIADALFQESAFPSRCASSSSMPRSINKSSMASNRVLFYNDEFKSGESWF